MKATKLRYYVCPEHKNKILFTEQIYDEAVAWLFKTPHSFWCNECEKWYLKDQCLIKTKGQLKRKKGQDIEGKPPAPEPQFFGEKHE